MAFGNQSILVYEISQTGTVVYHHRHSQLNTSLHQVDAGVVVVDLVLMLLLVLVLFLVVAAATCWCCWCIFWWFYIILVLMVYQPTAVMQDPV